MAWGEGKIAQPVRLLCFEGGEWINNTRYFFSVIKLGREPPKFSGEIWKFRTGEEKEVKF